MTTRYHINHDGKIYPCRAKVLKCPYSESLHSEDKVELYYKLMVENEGEIEPSENGMQEINDTNRLKSLHSLSSDIEKSKSPVELIIHTLGKGLNRMSNIDVAAKRLGFSDYIDKESEEVYKLISRGISVPSNVPEEISIDARVKFEMNDGGRLTYMGSRMGFDKMRQAIAKKDYKEYKKYKESLNEENYEGTYEWMSRDFEKFTRDLNASKMMTQPIFFGDLEQAKKSIKKMDGYELLSAFDDYSLSNKEIEENVKEANYFKFNRRRDLSKGANDALQTWYDRNREIYKSWKINSSVRILLSMEIADELDRREIIRQDKSAGKLWKEKESE